MAAYSFLLLGFLLRTLGPEAFAPWAAAVALLGYVSLLDAGLSATTTEMRHMRRPATRARWRRLMQRMGYLRVCCRRRLAWHGGRIPVPRLLGLTGPGPSGRARHRGSLASTSRSSWPRRDGLGCARLPAIRPDLRLQPRARGGRRPCRPGVDRDARDGRRGLGQVAGRLASRTVLAIALGRNVKWFHLVPGIPSRGRVRALWAFSLPVFALQLATQLGVGTDIVIVGRFRARRRYSTRPAASWFETSPTSSCRRSSVLLPTLSRATFQDALSTARQIPTLMVMAGHSWARRHSGGWLRRQAVDGAVDRSAAPFEHRGVDRIWLAFVLITPSRYWSSRRSPPVAIR